MEALDNLFGPRDKEQFARLLIDRLKRAGETRPVVYDSGRFCLTVDDDKSRSFELSNLYAQYRALPEDKQAELLQRAVNTWLVPDRKLPENFCDLGPHLLPALRSRAMYEFATLQARIAGGEATPPVYQVVAEHLGLGLIYERPDSAQYLTQHHLERWGVSFGEAMEAARANLAERRRPARFRTAANTPGIYISTEDDGCDASRLILVDLIRELQVRGDTVAMVPNQDILIVAGSEDAMALERMASIATDAMNRPLAISGMAVRLHGGEWVPWMPDGSRPQFRAFQVLRLQTMRMYYEEQRRLLETLHKQTGETVSVGQFNTVEKQSTGEAFSYCVWSSEPKLLPRTDRVAFMRDENDEPIYADWDRVCEVLGDLMEPQGVYPERYRVADFPYGHELRKLGGQS